MAGTLHPHEKKTNQMLWIKDPPISLEVGNHVQGTCSAQPKSRDGDLCLDPLEVVVTPVVDLNGCDPFTEGGGVWILQIVVNSV